MTTTPSPANSHEDGSVARLQRKGDGRSTLDFDDPTGEVLVDSRVVKNGRCFAVTVYGDGMINADIHDGDIVIFRRQPLAQCGDLVIAVVNNEAVLRRLYISDDTIQLRRENSKYSPTTVDADTEMRILGKVIAVSRTSRS